MNERFQFFWERLSRSARQWNAPEPTRPETRFLADNVLRELRHIVPDPAIWWTHLARRAAMVALAVALLALGFLRDAPEPALANPGQLAAAFLSHELQTAK